MPVAAGTYADVPDLRKGDIPLPPYMGDGSDYINSAAEEIDAQLGHVYVTPIEIDSAVAANRPAILLLKKMNWLIASGRLILNLATASEQPGLHAYGRQMLLEGLDLLSQVADGKIVLTGATVIDTGSTDPESFSGPKIFNEDSGSLVEGFYDFVDPVQINAGPVYPYGNNK